MDWITNYLTVHSLSVPSRRYAFLLWLAVLLVFLAFAVLHWSGSRGGLFGAVWSKWALRRRTWRKKHTSALAQRKNQPHRQPLSLPSNAQLLSLTILTLMSFTLAFVGPDYLAPSLKVWQIRSLPSQLYDTSPDMPQYTISKSLWSSSARVGQIAFALLPLCVLFALKAPPFAIFAIPFMIQLYFDKLAWLHRWAGWLIWFFVCVHVTLWSIQLAQDVNPNTGRVAYVYAWSYTPFIYGWIAFALLTLLILLSLYPIRRRFYEYFYVSHVVLVPGMLVLAALHHPTVAWWCWAAFFLWIGERFWRVTWWIYANGIVRGAARVSSPSSNFGNTQPESWEMDHIHRSSIESALFHLPPDGRSSSPLYAHYQHDPFSSADHDAPLSKTRPPASLYHSAERTFSRMSYSSSAYIPPPGYAYAELLSGRTVRLRLLTPGFLPWSPGQHFLLNIPSVSHLTSHPFTCASVCDEAAPTDAGRIMLFLVRAKGGWTQDLWNLVSRLTAERPRSDAFSSDHLPKHGVLLRTHVDGPFGSAKRARWGNYSTGIIITGGSGVSFGLSLLQYMCLCLSGRDGRQLGGRPGGWGRMGNDLKRVRFVWLVREYSHIHWCASILRHCMSIVPSSVLQIDVYVTNFKPVPLRHPAPPSPLRTHSNREFAEDLRPPHPNFVREDSAHRRAGSADSLESHEDHESDVDLSYYLGEASDDEPPVDEIHVAHERIILDLTNFDGDVDMGLLPGEAYFSHRIKKEGRIRRRLSRKLSNTRLSSPVVSSEARSPRERHVADSHQAYPDRYALQPPRVPPEQKIATRSTDRLLPVSPLSERPRSPSSETDLYSAGSARSSLPSFPRQSMSASLSSDLPSTVSLVAVHDSSRRPTYPTKAYPDIKSESKAPLSVQIPSHPYLQASHHSAGPVTATPSTSEPEGRFPFEMDPQEAHDVHVVAERARPGKPKLDKVIADEVDASKGAVVVACCGPTSLNAMVRKIVAAQIDPGRIRQGDMRGSITLVSEEFEY